MITEKLRKKMLLAMLIVLAVAFSGLERLIPNPFPWIKLGLANAVTLLVLVAYGFRPALGVTLGRIILASLIVGGMIGPAFVLSLAGGLASLLVMGLMLTTGVFSIIGLSVAGAFAHTLTQFALLFILVAGNKELLKLAPPFLLLSLLTGFFIGWLVIRTKEVFIRIEDNRFKMGS